MCMSCRTTVINNYDLINIYYPFLHACEQEIKCTRFFAQRVSALMSSRVACGRLCPARSPLVHTSTITKYGDTPGGGLRQPRGIRERKPLPRVRQFVVAIRTKLWPHSSKFNRKIMENNLPIPLLGSSMMLHVINLYPLVI